MSVTHGDGYFFVVDVAPIIAHATSWLMLII